MSEEQNFTRARVIPLNHDLLPLGGEYTTVCFLADTVMVHTSYRREKAQYHWRFHRLIGPRVLMHLLFEEASGIYIDGQELVLPRIYHTVRHISTPGNVAWIEAGSDISVSEDVHITLTERQTLTTKPAWVPEWDQETPEVLSPRQHSLIRIRRKNRR